MPIEKALTPGAVDTAFARSASTRTLPVSECYELLAVAVVARIGFVAPSGLTILPVDYRLGAGPRLFMLTAPDGAIAHLAETNASVAVEVDYSSGDAQIAWSVLMNGTISLLDDEARAAFADLRLPPMPRPGDRCSLAVQFRPARISGRDLYLS